MLHARSEAPYLQKNGSNTTRIVPVIGISFPVYSEFSRLNLWLIVSVSFRKIIMFSL